MGELGMQGEGAGQAASSEGSPLARPSSLEAGMRLSAELQLTYATGVVAGTLMAAYQIVDYGGETGFEGVWLLYASTFIASVLELVTAGMVLHIMYRGFWIAMRLLVETRIDQGLATRAMVEEWEEEIRQLDGGCQALFFRTFRILYAGMFWGAVFFGWSLAASDSTAQASLGWLLLAVVLPASLVRPVARGWKLAFLRPQLERLERALTGMRRKVGLWWLATDPAPMNRLQWVALAVGFVILSVLNWVPMMRAELEADKLVYFQGKAERITLTFRHGGLQAGLDIEAKLSAKATATTTSLEKAFERLGPTTYVAVLDPGIFRAGPVEVEVKMELASRSDHGQLRFSLSRATAHFLVSR
ncbi:MAG: hypothetical protein HY816_13015 [Candidatus Wallbacteria bacterium]|nr:hypothetical protein [Candidatus Wallbacteria bacterium]